MSESRSDSFLSGAAWKRNEVTLGTSVPISAVGGEDGSTQLTGYRILLITQSGCMKKLWLPEIPEGRVQFEQTRDGLLQTLSFEGKHGRWFLICAEPSFVTDDRGNRFSRVEIQSSRLFIIEYDGSRNVLYSECADSDGSIFSNYWVDQLCEIRIGRAGDNDLVVPNRFVSKYHAVITRNKTEWRVQDLGSSNGTFVNGVRVSGSPLQTGDTVSIMSLQILIGVDFLSMNDGNGRAKVLTNRLNRAISTDNLTDRELASLPAPDQSGQLFNRPPRKRYTIETQPIVVEAPPISLGEDSIPMVLQMGGSMAMSTASLLAGGITSMLGEVLFPVLTQRYSDKQRKEYEKKRVEKYTEYLKLKKRELEQETLNEERALNYNYPPISSILSFPEEGQRLWERRNCDDDFLTVRLGSGEGALIRQCDYPPRRFEMDEDPLLEGMYHLVESKHRLSHVPVMYSLVEDRVCGILGIRSLQLAMVKQMILQVALSHSYDEVKMVVLASETEAEQLEFFRYLPHSWDDQKSLRFLATDLSEAYRIGEYIRQKIGEDLEQPGKLRDIVRERAYFIVFALNKHLFDGMEVLKDALKSEKNCGLSVVALFDDLPKECTRVIELQATNRHKLVNLSQIDQPSIHFTTDRYDRETAAESVKRVSNLKLTALSHSWSLPRLVTFFELFNAGRTEHLNPVKRWRENNPVVSLAAPVGIGADGELFTLDLHEKYQGPHGLVAGMTGSGKSEFLLTYILSMALNYDPDEVAFVLIDYKGGGLAGAFEDEERGMHLPHVVGTVTNLDGATIQRALISIQSELIRRQHAFNAARRANGEGTMDIYTYQRLYRQGKVSEPIAHLFIVCDEFAELKQQQPEFMDQLISIARIGRSLGVHLILATQKPAGVVNDQILSNTKFRVCLKVQDRYDSMDMLNRPDAAELKETGRFYLQVGYNEYFAMGQSAWSGAPYEPQDQVVVKRDESVQFLDHVGQVIFETRPQEEKAPSTQSQLVAVVKLLSDLAARTGREPGRLWHPALAPRMSLDEMKRLDADRANNSITACLGMVDHPAKQEQHPLQFDFLNSRSLLIVGNPGSGKTTAIQSMLLTLAEKYSPEEVHFYILDYSSRMLGLFRSLPHCGEALGDEDTDQLPAFFQIIRSVIQERKKLFADLEIDSFESAGMVRSIPLILVVIDNISGLGGSGIGEELLFRLGDYVKNGMKYGIRFIVSCTHLSDCPVLLRREFGTGFALRAEDKYEIGDIIRCPCSYVPPDLPGRGMLNEQGQALEMQLAMFRPELNAKDRIQALKRELSRLAQRYPGSARARSIARIEEEEEYEHFAQRFAPGRLPLGYSLEDKKGIALPLMQLSSLSFYFGDRESVLPVLRNILCAAHRENMEVTLFPRTRESVFDGRDSRLLRTGSCKRVEVTEKSLNGFWNGIMDALLERKKLLRDYCAANALNASRGDIYRDTLDYMRRVTRPILLLFEDFSEVCTVADQGAAQVLGQILKMGRHYNLYPVGCFYPDNADDALGTALYKDYIGDEIILLFGRRPDAQRLCRVSREQGKGNGKGRPNRCVMHYRGENHPLLMPCGKITDDWGEDDTKSVF